MSWVRREDLDRVDREFGLVVNCAWEDSDTGVIQYMENSETQQNRREIDRRKSRKLFGRIGNFPIYCKYGQEAQVNKILKEFFNHIERLNFLLERIQQNNRKCGYKQKEKRYIDMVLVGEQNIDGGVVRNSKNDIRKKKINNKKE